MSQWLTEELSDRWKQSIPVRVKICEVQSAFQKIELYETERWGTLLVIDGKIQACEFDEFVYHEMIAHLPLLSHPKPEKIMVIGGGDGGTLRESLLHPVKEATLVEIDEEVIRLCQRYMPSLSHCISEDPRVKLVTSDAAVHIEQARDLDCILVDSSDPEGPSESLFSPAFYASLKAALKPDGIVALQAGSPFFFETQLRQAFRDLAHTFRYVRPYLIPIPTYPGGTWCLVTASDTIDPLAISHAELAARMHDRKIGNLRYYSPATHTGSLSLPPFIQEWVPFPHQVDASAS